MNKKVVVFGISILTEMIVHDAMVHDDFEIVAFTVNRKYINEETFMGLPLVPFEEIEKIYPPSEYDMLLAFSGQYIMRMRVELFRKVKKKGYLLRNYISPKADVSTGIQMGENNIVMALAHVGLNGIMGNNNLIRQHVYLGHDFKLGEHVFIAPGCRVGGACTIDSLCYIGLGSIISSGVHVSEESLVGSGSVVIRNTEPFSANVGNPSRVIRYHKEEGIKVGG